MTEREQKLLEALCKLHTHCTECGDDSVEFFNATAAIAAYEAEPLYLDPAGAIARLETELSDTQRRLGECDGGFETQGKEIESLRAEVQALREALEGSKTGAARLHKDKSALWRAYGDKAEEVEKLREALALYGRHRLSNCTMPRDQRRSYYSLHLRPQRRPVAQAGGMRDG